MENRYCINCIHFRSEYNYCNQFKIEITSIGNAAVCSKFSNKLKQLTIPKEKKSKSLKRCKDCKNLFFDSYCNQQKINITNINKHIDCDKFIDKYDKEEVKSTGVVYNIIKKIGVVSKSTKGWKKELNLVRWNDKEPKFDLREWNTEHDKMGKGITLNREELKALKDLLNNMEL